MNYIKVLKDGTTEVKLETIVDVKLQYNDLVIQYLPGSNVISIGYDETPFNLLYVFSVIEKGKPVFLKLKSNFPMGFIFIKKENVVEL